MIGHFLQKDSQIVYVADIVLYSGEWFGVCYNGLKNDDYQKGLMQFPIVPSGKPFLKPLDELKYFIDLSIACGDCIYCKSKTISFHTKAWEGIDVPNKATKEVCILKREVLQDSQNAEILCPQCAYFTEKNLIIEKAENEGYSHIKDRVLQSEFVLRKSFSFVPVYEDFLRLFENELKTGEKILCVKMDKTVENVSDLKNKEWEIETSVTYTNATVNEKRYYYDLIFHDVGDLFISKDKVVFCPGGCSGYYLSNNFADNFMGEIAVEMRRVFVDDFSYRKLFGGPEWKPKMYLEIPEN